MLSLLSNSVHQVISGMALLCRSREICHCWSSVSQVRFKELSPGDISLYMEKVDVLDKAGAYGIQESPELLGAVCDGEIENVIGLPLVKLGGLLERYGLRN